MIPDQRDPARSGRSPLALPVALPATARNLEILTAARAVLETAIDSVARQTDQAVIDGIAAEASVSGRLSWWRWRVGAILTLITVAAVGSAWLLAPAGPFPATLIIVCVVALIVAQRMDLHRSRLELSVLEDIPACVVVALAGCAAALGTSAVHGDAAPTFGGCFLFSLAQLTILVGLRGTVYAIFRKLRRNRTVSHPVGHRRDGRSGRAARVGDCSPTPSTG